MRIIELSELQFKNYSNVHSERNYFQTIEYAKMQFINHYKPLYLGLIDDNDNVLAATLILEQEIKGNKMGYAPGGFLIDYKDLNLLETFTNELKKYLEKLEYLFIRMNPLFPYKVYNRHGKIIKDNSLILNKLNSLDYQNIGYQDEFSKYEIITKAHDINSAYKNFNRNNKRNIVKNLQMGITIHQDNPNNFKNLYPLIEKKNDNSLEYYEKYLKYFNKNHLTTEIYYAKINTETYVNNFRYLLMQEESKNQKINEKIQDPNINKTDKIINLKLESDKKINKYKQEVIKATEIYTKYPQGLIVGVSMIIKNNREITFLVDGYYDLLKEIHASHLLKWEIMKKYIAQGYKRFNFGEIVTFKDISSKYYGLYVHKIGFGGKIIEYCNQLDLVVNKYKYKFFTTLGLFKFGKKK